MIEPFYADDSVTLYCGDWRESIAEDFAADLIVTDPPYGETTFDWDRWPDGWPALAARHSRAMWCFGSMRMFLDRRDEFAAWAFSQDLIWEKHNGSNLSADRFSRVHENAAFWYQGPWSEIHHETPVTADAVARTVRKKARPAQWNGATGASVYTSQDGGPRLMRSVLYCPSMHGKAINETEKPTPFLEHLITYGCPPGGTVVDFYAGSGSTGEACKLTGRKAVLFEKREQQCYEAAKRLASMPLFAGGVA